MKKSVLILAICVLQIWGSYAQDKNVELLKSTYKKGFVSKGKDSIVYQKAFFNAFPSNFRTFKKIYGWNDKSDEPSPLYDVSFEHINNFFALKYIDKNVLIKKMIGIAIYGDWEADAVGNFQHNLMQYATSNNEKFIEVLKVFKKEEIVSVWTFYFDYENSTIRKRNYDKAIKLVANNETMRSFITAGYLEASKRNKGTH